MAPVCAQGLPRACVHREQRTHDGYREAVTAPHVAVSTSLQRTYRYLRIGVAGTVVAILLAVAQAATAYGWLTSISDYFYTPARDVFVGALVAASLALFALSGRGVERALFDAAALFAPLIALVPTTLAPGAVPGVPVECSGTARCFPPQYEADTANGVFVYLVVGGLVVLVALLLLARRQVSPAGVWPSLLIAVVVLATVALTWALAHQAFLQHAHVVATTAFFALFGGTFLLTQYMQFVLGFTPLEAGVRLLPFSIVILVVSPLSARIVEKLGTKLTVATGLALVGTALVLMAQLQTGSSYGDLVWRMVLWAFGQALVMAPATESIMGSLPLAKAGVGSAVNDTTRQVGGALGVAIVGSVMSSTYGSKIVDFFAGTPSAGSAAEQTAKDSLGGALAVAAKAPGALGQTLSTVAKSAFVDGMHFGFLVAAGVAIFGAIVAGVWLPARATAENIREQAVEFAEEHETQVDLTADELKDTPAEI